MGNVGAIWERLDKQMLVFGGNYIVVIRRVYVNIREFDKVYDNWCTIPL